MGNTGKISCRSVPARANGLLGFEAAGCAGVRPVPLGTSASRNTGHDMFQSGPSEWKTGNVGPTLAKQELLKFF